MRCMAVFHQYQCTVRQQLCLVPKINSKPVTLASQHPKQQGSTAPISTCRAACTTAAVPSMASVQSQAIPGLWQRVLEVYEQAQQTGAASKTDTQVELVPDLQLGIQFVIRLATALKAKPKGVAASPSPSSGEPAAAKKEWRNPFLPYEEALWVQHLSDSHTLLLNKFNVVEHHVLVVTRDFQSQMDPLNAADIEATLKVLYSMPSGGVAFYNCGEYSGRSQPHKHLQVVPLPFHPGLPLEMPVQRVLDAAAQAAGAGPVQVVEVRQLPYQCYVARLPEQVTPEQIQQALSKMLQLAVSATGAGQLASLSYNVLLTPQVVMLVPRRAECCGPLALNSLAFAGTILVRSDDDLSFVKDKGPLAILQEVGCPWPAGSNAH